MLTDSQRTRLRLLIELSRLALIVEAVLPHLLLPAVLAAFFLILSWAGAWENLSAGTQNILLLLLLVSGLASLIPLSRQPFPQKKDALARLDRKAAHRVVSSLSDRLAMPSPEAAELWRLHQRKLVAELHKIKPDRPHPNIFRRDAYGLRFLIILLAVTAGLVAGPERWAKLRAAFEGSEASLTPPRLDAWITPPAYTGRAPIFLNASAEDARDLKLSVPEGSVLALRTEAGQGIELKIAGHAAHVAENESDSGKLLRFEEKLTQSGVFTVQHYGRPLIEGGITVEPDHAPQISLHGQVQILLGKSLRLRARVQDDYGVTQALAQFVFPEPSASRIDLRRIRQPQPLVEAPGFPLVLGLTRPRDTMTTTTKDITSHPYAGLPMLLQLVARDDAGNEARTEAGRILLPSRPFAQPLARALIALRQMLARDKNSRSAVDLGLELILAEPGKHIPDMHHYLQVSAVKAQLAHAYNDDDLRAVLDRLWNIAVYIEEGDLSDAERALAEAQARLEDALDRDASAEEISKLMNGLRQAMANYLKQLQNQAASSASKGKLPQNMKVLTQQDLERMMKQIEQLSRSGAKEAARQQLQNLRDLLSALRNSDPSASGEASAMQQRLEDIAGLMREQQKLMDETFKERNRQRRDTAPKDDAAKSLSEKQGELRSRLQDLSQGLEQNNSGKEMRDAGTAMGEAEEHLGQSQPDSALPEQGRALESMRKGAQGLMKNLQGSGQGEGSGYGFNQGEANGRDLDATGRYNPFSTGESEEDGNRVPSEADRRTIQTILDEVKRRLSDPQRPKIERDYLERLLQPF